MDRKQMAAERAREFFGERLDDVVHMVRQDRQELRGWQEPAHIRAVVRRAIQEGGSQEKPAGQTAVADLDFGRAAGEPDRGQQREAIGQLFEAGASALEKAARQQAAELTAEELLGLECILLAYGRPSLFINQEGQLSSVPPFWNVLEDQREDIEMAQRGVGRIELFGHPELDWAGTGFLVNETCLLTTKRTVELFVENTSGQWQFRPGISAWMDYRAQSEGAARAGYRVCSVIGVHDRYDLALLEVEPPQSSAGPTPLVLASQSPTPLERRPVYLVGYPVRDARRNEPERISRIFRDLYGVKRVQPGTLRGILSFRDVQLLQHDCTQLGQLSGGCILDLETHQVLGIHLSGRYLEPGSAVPLWMLRDDPLFKRAGVTFAEADSRQLHLTTEQLERLARSRFWPEVRAVIANMYQQAFGVANGPR